MRALPFAGLHVAASLVALFLSIINAFVHSRDGYTAVVPQGLTLSAVVVLVMLLATWLGWPRPRIHDRRRRHAMNTTLRFSPQPAIRLLQGGTLIAAACLMTACDRGDPNVQASQHGSGAALPAPKNYLLPPMKVLPAGSWKQGETPVVPASLKITALASGLMHPRFVYALPNGDILIVESNGPKQPEDAAQGHHHGTDQGLWRHGAKRRQPHHPGASGQRRRTCAAYVFLDHLNSPFGVALVGNDLYVANTDALMHFPYTAGETHDHGTGHQGHRPAGRAGAINHHWTKSLLASPDGSKLYVGVGSNSNITENGIEAEPDRAAILEVDRASGARRASSPRPAQSERPAVANRRPGAVGGRSTSATSSAPTSCPTT